MAEITNLGLYAPAVTGPKPSPSLQVIRPVGELLSAFPSTRYYGSKRKLLPWIYENLRSLDFETVLDPFGGTASVSLLFKAMRKRVTYSDALSANEDIARTVLADNVALSREQVASFFNEVRPQSGFIASHFSGVFYTDRENEWLDGFCRKLAKDDLTNAGRSLLRYLLFQACLKKRPYNLFHRANLALRTREGVERSFGNASTWERSFVDHALSAYDELRGLVIPHGGECNVLPSGNAEDIHDTYDLIYLDPPYVSNRSKNNLDNYWRRYHFLECLHRYEEWPQIIEHSSRIKEPCPPAWMLDWSRSPTFKEKLYSIVRKHRRSVVVLSYVTDAFPTSGELKEFFEDTFAHVSLHTIEYSHALSKSRKREVLLVGRGN